MAKSTMTHPAEMAAAMEREEHRAKLLEILRAALDLVAACNALDTYAGQNDPAGYGAGYRTAQRAWHELGYTEAEWDLILDRCAGLGGEDWIRELDAHRAEELDFVNGYIKTDLVFPWALIVERYHEDAARIIRRRILAAHRHPDARGRIADTCIDGWGTADTPDKPNIRALFSAVVNELADREL